MCVVGCAHAGNMVVPGLTGSLPATLADASQLVLVDVSENNITGMATNACFIPLVCMRRCLHEHAMPANRVDVVTYECSNLDTHEPGRQVYVLYAVPFLADCLRDIHSVMQALCPGLLASHHPCVFSPSPTTS